MNPSPKMAVSKIFLEVLSCNLQRIGIGSRITMTSMIRSAEAMAVYICCALVSRSEVQSNTVWDLQATKDRKCRRTRLILTMLAFPHVPGIATSHCRIAISTDILEYEAVEGSHLQLSSVDRKEMHQPRTFRSSTQ